MPRPWTAYTGDAAAMLGLAEAFKTDRAARRHFLQCAMADLSEALEARKLTRPAHYLRK